MEAETAALIDTAIKVGLGAIISGITAYVITGRNHEHEEAKTKWEARKSLVIETLKTSQEYFSACSNFVAHIDGVSKEIESSGKPKPDYITFLKEADKQFLQKRFNIELCYGYLLVLAEGKSEPASKLWEYHDLLSELRNLIFSDPKLSVPNQESLEEYRTKLSELRVSYFVSINTLLKLKSA